MSTVEKNLLNSNISRTCLHNMVNFGSLAAEICWPVWGTLANFNGFRVLAALLHGTSSGRQPNSAALNRRRHLYSAGRPSRWTLAPFKPRSISLNPSIKYCGIYELGPRLSTVCCYKATDSISGAKFEYNSGVL